MNRFDAPPPGAPRQDGPQLTGNRAEQSRERMLKRQADRWRRDKAKDEPQGTIKPLTTGMDDILPDENGKMPASNGRIAKAQQDSDERARNRWKKTDATQLAERVRGR